VSEQPALISQQGNASVPASDSLADAVLWDYGFTFAFRGDTTFDVTYNEERTISYSLALEDAGGIAQVRVTASAGSLPLVLYPDTTLVATINGYHYRNDDGTLLTFEDAVDRFQRTVVIERLDALDVQSARATMQEVTFPNPMIPFIENATQLDIGGSASSLPSHLTAMLQALLANSPFAIQPISLECRYAYVIGGVPVEAPVLLLPRSDFAIGFDEQIVDQIASGITRWLDAVQPPETGARLIFALTFWTAIPRMDARLLRLTNLSLAMTDVVR
jgi:hypothetical protein